MKVWILESWGMYPEDGSEIGEVYSSAKAAKASCDHVREWNKDGEDLWPKEKGWSFRFVVRKVK